MINFHLFIFLTHKNQNGNINHKYIIKRWCLATKDIYSNNERKERSTQ